MFKIQFKALNKSRNYWITLLTLLIIAHRLNGTKYSPKSPKCINNKRQRQNTLRNHVLSQKMLFTESSAEYYT